MSTREHLLEVAASKIGTGETPPGSNCQVFSKGLGRPCEAWCADSVVSIMREAGIKLPSESAYTPTMYNGFVNAGTAVYDLAHGLQPGDVIFFDFVAPFSSRQIQHVGIFVKYLDAGNIETLEGNTSSGTSGSQDNGDGYYRRHRPLQFIVGAGRPPYQPAGTPPPPPLPAPPAVHPEYDPALNLHIVSGVGSPNGGAWLVGADGSIYSFGGAMYLGGPNGKDYWAGRTAKRLESNVQGGYDVISTDNARYSYPGQLSGIPVVAGPEYNPALNLVVVGDQKAPAGGVWLLSPDGAIFGFGNAPYKGGANGQGYFAGRTAYRLEAFGDGYTIVDSTGARYDYP